MSDPTADGAGGQRESRGGVIAVGVGLVLAAVALVTLFTNRPREADPVELLAEDFEIGELPPGFSLERGLRLSGDERIVLIRGPVPLDEDPPRRVEPSAEEEAPDWAALPEGPRGTPPARVLLLGTPRTGAQAALDRAFRKVEWKDLADLGREGGRTAVDGGKLEWAGLSADWIRERLFEPAGTFRDEVRVNLTAGSRCWILHAIWPRGLPGDTEPLRGLLDALRPRVAAATR